MGINLRNLGTTAQYAPIIKRATGTLSNGLAVAVVADANQAGFSGDDATGVAKLHFYKSADSTRTSWALNLSTTPTPAPCSSTKAAVLSMAVDGSNNLHVVYQGTDNSLQYIKFTVSGSTWSVGANQVIIAASAVTDRFRAVDIDVATNNPAVIVYESSASTGQGAYARVYVQLNDGTTWIKAYESQIHSTAFILAGSEDVSISYDTSGPQSNVARYLIFFTRSGTTADQGDIVREITFNVSTGTANSATVVGTWPVFNQNVASGSRRGWIFKINSTVWQVAMLSGLQWPKYQVMRLTHNSFGAPTVDSTITSTRTAIPRRGTSYHMLPQIDRTANLMTSVSCSYQDNKVMFGFITANSPTYSAAAGGKTLGALVFGYSSSSSFSISYSDNQMRPMDEFFVYGAQPIAVYGCANTRTHSSDFKINFTAIYGYTGNTVAPGSMNKLRFVLNDFFDEPEILAPATVQPTNTPTLQVRVQNNQFYPNIRGKIEWTLATNAGFTVNARTIIESDANFRSFGSTNNQAPPPINVAYTLTEAESLFTATWYIRSRVVDDLGRTSAWSSTKSFIVQHAPTALPTGPAQGSLNAYGTGSVAFTWTFNDTENDDVQTAYQLLITRVDTGASVLDTGKILSSVESSTQTISSSLKDIPLQWQVSLWDVGDTQGPFSNATLFTLSDAPSIAVTSPVAGGTVTSAMPTVSWTPTIAGSRTQKAFRVLAYSLAGLDRYGRSVGAGNWNAGDYGITWSIVSGTASYFSVDGSSGLIAVNAVNVEQVAVAGVSVQDVEIVTQVTVDAVATGAAFYVDIPLRYINDNDMTRVRFIFQTDATVQIQGVRRVAGVSTFGPATTVPSFTYAGATKYTTVCRLVDSVMEAKIFTSSGAEPAGWHFTSTNVSGASYVIESGDVGIRAILFTGNTNTLPFTFKFDNFSIRDLSVASIADSQWSQGDGGSYTFSTNIMDTDLPYSVHVYVQDSGGLQGWSQSNILTDWIEPALGNITTVMDDYGTTISWTNLNVDADFVAWRIYRRYMKPAIVELDDENTANLWEMIHETDVNTTAYSYKDYLTPLNKVTNYVVVQVADRFGSLIESNITSYSTVTLVGDRYFFIPSVAIGTIAAYEAVNVVADSYTSEVEQEILHVKGRGRQVQVGDDLGVSGTLTIHLRNPANASADMQFIQRLASSKTINVYMKTPFGQVFYVKFGSIPVSRLAGVGTAELVDLQVPYTEVYGDEPITRLS